MENKVNIGDIFGQLAVKKISHYNKEDKKPVYLCKCSCGGYVNVKETNLLNGSQHSCQSPWCKDSLIGRAFGEWTVMARDKSRPGFEWCKCSCGNKKSVSRTALLSGTSKSCGCIKPEERHHDEAPLPENIQELYEAADNALERLLIEYGIPFKRKHLFEGCSIVFNFVLFNEVGEVIGIIENRGDRHYSQFGTCWNTPERQISRRKGDYVRMKFAEDSHIPMLVIPYQFFDELEKFLMTSEFWKIISKKFND